MAVVVFGLGNDGLSYFDTKHNAGRIVMDLIVKKLALSYQQKSNYYFVKSLNYSQLSFVYATGFMNESGRSLLEYLNYFKFDNPNSHVLILQDDSDIAESKHKLSQAGRSAGHKGIDSIYQHLLKTSIGQENIWRLKIGIRPEGFTGKSSKFVLKKVNSAEIKHYVDLADFLISRMDMIALGDFAKLQNQINTN